MSVGWVGSWVMKMDPWTTLPYGTGDGTSELIIIQCMTSLKSESQKQVRRSREVQLKCDVTEELMAKRFTQCSVYTYDRGVVAPIQCHMKKKRIGLRMRESSSPLRRLEPARVNRINFKLEYDIRRPDGRPHSGQRL